MSTVLYNCRDKDIVFKSIVHNSYLLKQIFNQIQLIDKTVHTNYITFYRYDEINIEFMLRHKLFHLLRYKLEKQPNLFQITIDCILHVFRFVRDYDLFLYYFNTYKDVVRSLNRYTLMTEWLCGTIGMILPPLNTEIIKFLFSNGVVGNILRKVVQDSNLELLNWIVDNGYFSSQSMDYVLVHACENGNVDIIDKLFRIQFEINNNSNNNNVKSPSKHLSTPFTLIDLAASKGHYPMVRYLYEVRSERFSSNAFDFAAEGGHFSIFQYLKEKSNDLININQEAYNKAANHGHLEIIRYLFLGTENSQVMNRFTAPLRYAFIRGHLPIVQFLHDSAPELFNRLSVEDLVGAVKCKSIAVIKYIESIYRSRYNWRYIFHCSLATGSSEISNFLLLNQKQLDQQQQQLTTTFNNNNNNNVNNNNNYNINSFTVNMIKSNFNEMFYLCLNNSLELVIEGNDLVFAILCKCNIQVVQYLHSRGVESSPTAMDIAAANGNLEIVQFLQENRTEGCTKKAIQEAIIRGHTNVANYLMEHRTEHQSIPGSLYFNIIETQDRSINISAIEMLHSLFPNDFKENSALIMSRANKDLSIYLFENHYINFSMDHLKHIINNNNYALLVRVLNLFKEDLAEYHLALLEDFAIQLNKPEFILLIKSFKLKLKNNNNIFFFSSNTTTNNNNFYFVQK